MTDEADAELAITWGLFVKLQTAPEGELQDVWSFYEAAAAEIGDGGLLRGWDLLAAILCQRLQEHAAELGCDCGSLDWLRREQVRLAGGPP